MIPLRLYIKNFLSYGTPVQTINFEPYHLICLSGKNGHGKSALLDAITWSLWGQARKMIGVTKSDEGLVRLGQTEMQVALDFVCNGATYRVRREYTQARGKATSHLDFGVLDTTLGRFKQLTEKTIRETQDLISKTIGIDAEAFESSVFLRQGHSNEFTRKSPRERKEVLANILGLGTYERLRKRAVEQARDELVHKQHMSRSCELLMQEAEQYQTLKAQLVEVCAQYDQILAEEKDLQARQERGAEQQKELVRARYGLQHIRTEIERVKMACVDQISSLRKLYHAWRLVRRQHRSMQHIHDSLSRRDEMMRKLAELRQSFDTRMQTVAQVAQHKEQLQHAMQRLHKLYQERCVEERKRLQTAEQHYHALQQEQRMVLQARAELEGERVRLEEVSAREAQQAARSSEYAGQIARAEKLVTRYQACYQRTQVRWYVAQSAYNQVCHEKEQLAHNSLTACSWCHQPIAAGAAHELFATQLEQKERQRLQRQKRLQRVLQSCEERSAQEQARLLQLRAVQGAAQSEADMTRLLESAQRVNDAVAAKTSRLLQIQAEISGGAELVAQGRASVAEQEASYQAMVAGDEQCQELQKQITVLEQILAASAGDLQMYQQLERELAEAAALDAQRVQLLQELALQQDRIAKIRALSIQIRTLRHEKLKLDAQEMTYLKLVAEGEVSEIEMGALRDQLVSLCKKKETIAQQKGALEHGCRHHEQRAALLLKEQESLRLIEQNIAEYAMLSQILGKDGIQGMLIEQILPEIEYDANLLLSKLTDNQAQLRFESVRELKSGGMKETLEIKISDALGIRPYELFSGGEAFRIDFALRLAISKFLARRAGTSIQTLIIDEGFGSQDEEGLHHIMESLYAIQDEFAKIIIVSHLPSMKDQFPVHFCVAKGPRGSTVQVMQQG